MRRPIEDRRVGLQGDVELERLCVCVLWLNVGQHIDNVREKESSTHFT